MKTSKEKATTECGERLYENGRAVAICTQPCFTEHSHHDYTAYEAVRRGLARRVQKPDQKIAEQVSALFGDDGEQFATKDGRSLADVCGAFGAVRSTDRDEYQQFVIYEFPDGSAIVEAENAWDLRPADCLCGHCWEGEGADCSEPVVCTGCGDTFPAYKMTRHGAESFCPECEAAPSEAE